MTVHGQQAIGFARLWFAMLIGMLLVPFLVVPAAAQTPVASPAAELEAKTSVTVDFPTGLRLNATLTSPEAGNNPADDEVDLMFRVGDEVTERLVIVPAADIHTKGNSEIAISTVVDFQHAGIPPGLDITYWWQIHHDGEIAAASQEETTRWFDNRQEWLQIESEQVRLNYFGLDLAFAHQIVESAQSTITRLEASYSLQRSRPLSIWVYPTQESFRGSLPPNSRDTIAGGSFIGYSLITAVIPDGSTSEIGRVIPHEVSHQVLFQATQNPYTILPVWFDEGMATHTQVGGTSNYMGMVKNASVNDALFDVQSLAASFPFVPSQATLAYAASWSAIEYIEQTYGEHGIAAMIAAFKSGVSYDQVVRDALGISMEDLNSNWKAWVAAQISS